MGRGRGAQKGTTVAARRGVWLVFSLILLAVAISMTGVAASYVLFSHGPTVPSNTALVLKIEGDVAEIEPSGFLDQLLPAQPTVRGVVDMLQRAKTYPRVK